MVVGDEAIEGHAETIEQRRRTVGTVPDLGSVELGGAGGSKIILIGFTVAGPPLALIGLDHCRRVFLWTGSVNSCAANRYGTAQILVFATVDMLRIRRRPGSRSDRRDNGFVGLARRAIIDPQIEAWFLRFDAKSTTTACRIWNREAEDYQRTCILGPLP